MSPGQRDERPVATRRWLAVAVVVFVVVGGVSAGVTGAPVGADAPVGGAPSAVGDAPQETNATLSGVIPLSAANTELLGAGENDTFGAALAHGDVNGDGVEDVIVGAPLNDSAGNNSGAVYVFYGPVNESELVASAANVTLVGANPRDWAGYSVAAGDVNDDNRSDVVVGAPLADLGGPAAGVAYVVTGGDLSGVVSLSNANHVLVGVGAGDLAGFDVSTVNATGGDTVLVGAPRNDSTAPNAGAAYVVAGLDEQVVSLADVPKLAGEAEGDLAGWSVASAGDFDGDGSADVVVGARRNDSVAPDAGAAYVVTEPNVSGVVSLSDARVKLAGVGERANAGWAVAAAGDVNNDSFGDVVVGAPFNDTGGTNAGVAYVAYGGNRSGTIPLPQAGVVLVGEAARDHAGYAVSSAGSGDVTCDAFADVLVGAPGNNSTAPNAGAAYVVAGGGDLAAVLNLSAAQAKLVGEGRGDRAGRAVSDAGNVTGNDTEDVLVGAPFNDSTAPNAGAAYVVEGACPPAEKPTTTTPTPTPEPELEITAASPECGVLVLDNPTDERVVVEVAHVDEDADGKIVLEPGETRRIEVEPGRVELTARDDHGERVLVNGEESVVVEVEACPTPTPTEEPFEPDVAFDCTAVTVSADDFEAVTLVFADGTTQTFDGPFEGEETFAGTGDHDGKVVAEVVVSGDGREVRVTNPDLEECLAKQLEAVEVSTRCAEGGGVLAVTNPNDVAVEVVVEGPGDFEERVEVEPGETVAFTGLEDGEYRVRSFTADGHLQIGDGETVTVDCPEPAELATECRDGEGVLRVTNPNDVPVFVDVSGPGEFEKRVTVEPGETVAFTGLADGEYAVVTLNAEDEHVFEVGQETVTVDCPEETPTPTPTPTTTETPTPTPTTTTTTTTTTATPTPTTTPTPTPTPTPTTTTTTTTTREATCPPGLQAKFGSPQGDFERETLVGASTLNVTVTGDAQQATITNDEPFALDVYVWAAGAFELKGTVDGDGGTLTVGGITTTNPAGKQITHDIGNVAVVCAGSGPPTIPPYSTAGQNTVAPALERLDAGGWRVVNPTNHSVAFTAATFDGSATDSGTLAANATTTVQLPADAPVLLRVDGVVVDVAGLDGASGASTDSSRRDRDAGSHPNPVRALPLVGLLAAAGLAVRGRE